MNRGFHLMFYASCRSSINLNLNFSLMVLTPSTSFKAGLAIASSYLHSRTRGWQGDTSTPAVVGQARYILTYNCRSILMYPEPVITGITCLPGLSLTVDITATKICCRCPSQWPPALLFLEYDQISDLIV